MAAFRMHSSGYCSFCAELCTGPFRHVLVIGREELEQRYKSVLLELQRPVAPLGQPEGFQTCDKCRRRLIASHHIPESCFRIMPSAEVEMDVKVEESQTQLWVDEMRGVLEEEEDDTMDADEDLPNLALIPETEMRIKGENGDVYVINSIDGRTTREAVEKCDPDAMGPIIKSRRKRRKKAEMEADRLAGKDRSFPIRHHCPFCNKGFSDKTLMTTHVRWHTGEKPFKCEQCGKGFAENSKLKLHVRTHTGERPYACPHCPKTFTQSVTLRIHIRIHTRETPYKCHLCEKGFTQSYNLTLHLRKQHDQVTVYRGREVGVIQKYKCPTCGKNYRSSKSFKLHQKLHNTGKLFNCEKCGKKYTYVHKCPAEQEDPEGTGKIYPCTICDKQFKYQQSLVYHMSNKHNQFSDGKQLKEALLGSVVVPSSEDGEDGEIVGC